MLHFVYRLLKLKLVWIYLCFIGFNCMWFLWTIWREGILQFLGGLGFFLFWMNYLEQAVSSVTNWWFKNLLKKFTSSVPKSFWSWILITTILESSNVVSVLVLAFVWTGILSLTSALAVILGSNVWTMITSSALWIVGLSLNVSVIALPLIFLWAIGMNFFPRWWKVDAICKFLFSFGLIFLAFSLIKDWLAFVTEIIDFSDYIDMSPWFFFLLFVNLLLCLLNLFLCLFDDAKVRQKEISPKFLLKSRRYLYNIKFHRRLFRIVLLYTNFAE